MFLFTAEHYDRDDAALAVLLGSNGLRVSEASATNVEDLGIERGHRTLRILAEDPSRLSCGLLSIRRLWKNRWSVGL